MQNPNYITRQPEYYGDQPPAKVKQMAPAPQPIDPRMLAAAMQQMGAMQQAPMSGNDGVNITISIEPQGIETSNYVDAYQQQAQQFSESELGQQLARPFEDTFNEEHRPVRKRSQEILSQHLGFRPADQIGDCDMWTPPARRRR